MLVRSAVQVVRQSSQELTAAKGGKRANERRIEILLTDSSVIFLIIVEGIVFPPAQKGLVKRRLRHD